MAMAACWRRILFSAGGAAPAANPRLFFSTRSPYLVKVGIPEFLHGVGKGVEAHVSKLEAEIGDFQKLLVTRTLRLKKLGIPCKHFSFTATGGTLGTFHPAGADLAAVIPSRFKCSTHHWNR